MKAIDMIATGNCIKLAIKKSSYNARTLSEAIGVSPLAIYKWTSGRNLPTLDNLVIMSDLLKMDLDSLIVTREVV